MASFITSPDHRFPAGTVLNVYMATGGGRPIGTTIVTSATVASNGAATFTGLTEGLRYVAGRTVAGPFVAITIAVPVEEGNVSVATLATAFNDILETADGWPDRPTLDGEEIPWPMRWRSLPGSSTNPAEKMAEFDTFLPVPGA